MTQDTTYRSVSLAVLVVLAAAVGAVAVTGTVAAQDAGDDTGENTTNTTDAADANTDESFYTPSAEDPLNVRFRDCCGHTVHSVDEGVLNLNIVNGLYNGDPYDVKITASGLSESQIESIVFDGANYDTENLGRTAIVGTNFTGVPSGEYVFTVSVVGTDATETVLLEVTDGPSAATDEAGMDNATAGTETGMDNATTDETMAGNETQMENTTQMGNMTGTVSISAAPDTTGAVANYTISVPVSAGSAGNLSAIAINFTGTNASLFGVNPASIYAVNITQPNGSVITAAGNVTAVSGGFTGLKAIIQFDENKTVSADDRILIRFGGVTNPAKPGTYTIGVDVNPERGNVTRTASLTITQNASAGNETQMRNEAGMGNATQMGTMTGNVSVSVMPNTTGAVANYTVAVPVDAASAGNLSAIAINFTGTNASLFGVNPASIYAVNITQPNGSVITAAGNVTAVSGGFTGLKAIIQFDENKTVSADDRILIRFGGVTNPAKPGTYTIGIDVNPERGNTTYTATFTIAQNASAGGTNATTTPMTTATEMGAATTSGTMMATGTDVGTVSAQTATDSDGGTGGNGSDGGQQGTPAGGPGFGIAVAIVALLAAALLAVRRN